MLKYAVLLLPIISGFITAFSCGTSKESGKVVKYRPPPIVFSIGWSLLYILLGLSWYYAITNNNNVLVNVMYSMLVFTLILWVIMYSCMNDKKNSIYVLLLSLMFGLMCLTVSDKIISKLLIIPLLVWLNFALLMNTTEVQHT
jgi:benzodiazapine receptor